MAAQRAAAVAGVKTTSYAENVVALAAAHTARARTRRCSPTRAGELCEGTGSNVFVVRSTAGWSRRRCSSAAWPASPASWSWSGRLHDGLAVVEAEVPMGVWRSAGTVLLTSSTRDVQPVNVLDGRPLVVSDLALRAARLFAVRAAKGMDP